MDTQMIWHVIVVTVEEHFAALKFLSSSQNLPQLYPQYAVFSDETAAQRINIQDSFSTFCGLMAHFLLRTEQSSIVGGL